MASETAPLWIEQLSKALLELEACNAASGDKVQWKEMEEHFLNLDAAFKKKIIELEAKEKELEQKESETNALIAEREAGVAAKEQQLLDRVQEHKDVAVAAVLAVASICDVQEEEEAAGESRGTKVSSSSFNGRNSTVENGEDVVRSDVIPRPELVEFCQQMDAPGLVNYTLANKKNLYVLRSELSVALASAAEPARFVLALLEVYFPPLHETEQSDDDERDGAHASVSKSRLIFLEALAAFMASRAHQEGGSYDIVLNHEIRQQAKQIADMWMLKLASEEGTEEAKGHHYPARAALLQLLAIFEIASEFEQDELCELVLAVAHRKPAPSLCRSLGLSEKMPDIIQMLIKSGRQVDAVRFIHAFQLTESFPPVPLLKAYLKELRRNSQGKGTKVEGSSSDPQNDVNTRELEALKAIIGSVKEFNLEASYDLQPLRKRLEQLENMRNNKKRGPGGDRGDRDHSRKEGFKKFKSKGGAGAGPHHNHNKGSNNNNKHRAAGFGQRGASYSMGSSRYSPVAHPHHHHHLSYEELAGQSQHSQQPFELMRSFNPAAPTTSYTAYTTNGLHHNTYPPPPPYM